MYDVLNAYLENGLKIVLHKIENAKTVSCGLWINQGSKYEIKENNGMSHLLEHLLLNLENKENPEFHNMMIQASAEGVIYNAATTKESTCFYFTGLQQTLKTCIGLLANIAYKNRKFTEDFLENEKKVVLKEATSFYSSFSQIQERTSQALWGNVGIGRIIMGSIDNIRNARLSQIKQILEEAYTPGNATLVIVGNVDYQETLKIVEEKFIEWKDKKIRIYEDVVDSTPGIFFNESASNSSVLSVGFRGVPYNSTKRNSVDMFTRLLGGNGMQARLIHEIRMKRGLAYTVGGFVNFYKNCGSIGFAAVCDHDKTVEVAKIMMNEFQKIKEDGFSEEEIEREKKMMETSMLLSIDNITEHLRYIGKCSSLEGCFFIENEIRMIKNITSESLQLIANDILQEENLGLAAIGKCNPDELLENITMR